MSFCRGNHLDLLKRLRDLRAGLSGLNWGHCQEKEEMQRAQEWDSPLGSPRVLAMPVFTLSVQMWLIRFSCSGLASTTMRMFQSVWMATWWWWWWEMMCSVGTLSILKGFNPSSHPGSKTPCLVIPSLRMRHSASQMRPGAEDTSKR